MPVPPTCRGSGRRVRKTGQTILWFVRFFLKNVFKIPCQIPTVGIRNPASHANKPSEAGPPAAQFEAATAAAREFCPPDRPFLAPAASLFDILNSNSAMAGQPTIRRVECEWRHVTRAACPLPDCTRRCTRHPAIRMALDSKRSAAFGLVLPTIPTETVRFNRYSSN